MSYLEYSVKTIPSGFAKVLHLNWALVLLLVAVASVGFLMLYSVAGGSYAPWAEAQMKRFIMGLVLMFGIAMVPIWFWRNVSGVLYAGSVILLVLVEVMGTVQMGAQRWIDLGFMRLQPSELTKITLVMFLASYYDWLPAKKTSRPFWIALPILIIILPTYLVLRQPDLGTSLLLLMGGATVIFLAGVHWAYFAAVIAMGIGLVTAVFQSRGQSWQLLKDYQYRRIDTFLDPASDPLGAGYHITQSKIALGSGGWTGRGYMQGTQSRLNFLPEKHTDFIFTTLAEEFGFLGGVSLLSLYALISIFCVVSALQNPGAFKLGTMATVPLNVAIFLVLSMVKVLVLVWLVNKLQTTVLPTVTILL